MRCSCWPTTSTGLAAERPTGGRPDQRQLDEFLESLSELGTRLARAQDWLGLRHGRFFKHETERPLGDLYVTMLKRYGVNTNSFAENAGEFLRFLLRSVVSTNRGQAT